MTEMVSSVLVHETVSQILSGLVRRYEGKENSTPNDDLERLEMAHIKLEAVLEASSRWQITTGSPLSRWRKKLKRAARECDDTLYEHKKMVLEEEETEQEVRNSSFPRRLAHATRSFVFSALGRRSNDGESSSSRSAVVRRFEWFADSASEFLRFVELGGTPSCRRHMPLASFARHLFAGKELQHRIVGGDEHEERHSSLLWLAPFVTEEHGTEACLVLIKKDRGGDTLGVGDSFFFSVILQLSESTDMVGTAVECLNLFPAHFQPAADTIRKELTQLPTTQDFSWAPYAGHWHKRHWDDLHSFSTRWFRPDPLCCKQQQQHGQRNRCTADAALGSVVEVNLQCQISLLPSEHNGHRTTSPSPTSEGRGRHPLRDRQNLEAGLLFSPHGSSESMLPPPADTASSTTVSVHGGEQHTGVTLEQLEEIVLPRAVDHFQRNTEATVYQTLWKAVHGAAYIHFAKPGTRSAEAAPGARRASRSRGASRRKLQVRREDLELHRESRVISHVLDLWGAHAPVELRGLVLDWIRKEKERQCLRF